MSKLSSLYSVERTEEIVWASEYIGKLKIYVNDESKGVYCLQGICVYPFNHFASWSSWREGLGTKRGASGLAAYSRLNHRVDKGLRAGATNGGCFFMSG